MGLKPMKCPNCGKSVKVNPRLPFTQCNACGEHLYADMIEMPRRYDVVHHFGGFEFDHDRDKSSSDTIKEKIALIAIIVCALAVFMPTLMYWFDDSDDEANKPIISETKTVSTEGYVTPGASAYSFEGESYQFVEATLRAAGFTNIETIDLDDQSLFNIKKDDNLVVSISINGDASFGSSNYYSPDAKVVISYH